MYVIWNERPTGKCRLSYSKVEELPSLREAEHTIVRACANMYGFREPCTLTIISDVPKGTGLGSSSALSVALCKIAGIEDYPHFTLPEAAFFVERKVSPVGIQDHLPAFYGNFRVYDIKAGSLAYTTISQSMRHMIEDWGLLLYTGETRKANDILPHWEKDISALKDIQALAIEVAGKIDALSIDTLSYYLKHAWKVKSSIKGVVNDILMDQYAKAIILGARAGKLLGAGGGGCWFFLAHPSIHDKIRDELGLVQLPFKIPLYGVEMRTI